MRSIQHRPHQNKCVCIRFAFALNSYWSSSGRNTVLIPSTIISIYSISVYSSQIFNHGASFRQKQGRARQRESLARRRVDPHGPRLPLPVDDLSFGHDYYLSSVITCSQPKPRAYGLKPEKQAAFHFQCQVASPMSKRYSIFRSLMSGSNHYFRNKNIHVKLLAACLVHITALSH